MTMLPTREGRELGADALDACLAPVPAKQNGQGGALRREAAAFENAVGDRFGDV